MAIDGFLPFFAASSTDADIFAADHFPLHAVSSRLIFFTLRYTLRRLIRDASFTITPQPPICRAAAAIQIRRYFRRHAIIFAFMS